METNDIAHVQRTWEMVLGDGDDLARTFYDRLFTTDPSLRQLFAETDMAEQRKKVMQIITVAVRGLGKLNELTPAVEALGRAHAGYGVKNEHYQTVGAALAWTLAQRLGPAFTPEVREAWTRTYVTLAGIMQRAAGELAA